MRSASGGGFDGKVCASYYVVSTLSHITHNLSTWGRLVSSRIIGEETLARMNHVVVQSRCLDAKFRYTGFANIVQMSLIIMTLRRMAGSMMMTPNVTIIANRES